MSSASSLSTLTPVGGISFTLEPVAVDDAQRWWRLAHIANTLLGNALSECAQLLFEKFRAKWQNSSVLCALMETAKRNDRCANVELGTSPLLDVLAALSHAMGSKKSAPMVDTVLSRLDSIGRSTLQRGEPDSSFWLNLLLRGKLWRESDSSQRKDEEKQKCVRIAKSKLTNMQRARNVLHHSLECSVDQREYNRRRKEFQSDLKSLCTYIYEYLDQTVDTKVVRDKFDNAIAAVEAADGSWDAVLEEQRLVAVRRAVGESLTVEDWLHLHSSCVDSNDNDTDDDDSADQKRQFLQSLLLQDGLVADVDHQHNSTLGFVGLQPGVDVSLALRGAQSMPRMADVHHYLFAIRCSTAERGQPFTVHFCKRADTSGAFVEKQLRVAVERDESGESFRLSVCDRKASDLRAIVEFARAYKGDGKLYNEPFDRHMFDTVYCVD